MTSRDNSSSRFDTPQPCQTLTLRTRSETSLSFSQPLSWSDVAQIEDITQDGSFTILPAPSLDDIHGSSSESPEVEASPAKTPKPVETHTVHANTQAVCIVKRFRARSRSRGPGLPIAHASATTGEGPALSTTEQHRLLPLSHVRGEEPRGHVSRSSHEISRSDACMHEWQELLLIRVPAKPRSLQVPTDTYQEKPRAIYGGHPRALPGSIQAVPGLLRPQ